MHRLRTVAATLIVALAASLAHAFEFPSDAEFIVTDEQGVIVAIGRAVDGASAIVEVLSGFEGPARLTLFRRDGSTRSIDVAIADGVVTIAGVDLRVLLSEVFEEVAVRFVAEPGVEPGDESGGREGPGAGAPEPPGQDRRPEEPPGQERRPEAPPGQDRRPDEAPGHDRRPE